MIKLTIALALIFTLLQVVNGYNALRIFGRTNQRAYAHSLRCAETETSAESVVVTPTVDRHQVFVGNMPFEVSEEEMSEKVLEIIGDAGLSFQGVNISKDRNTGRSRGFGYVNFDTKEDAATAVEKLACLNLMDRDLRIDLSLPKEERPQRERKPRTPVEHSVFIGNLDFSVTQEEVKAMCDDILGAELVERVRIAVDRDNKRPRGFGHIDFSSREGAEAAVTKLNGINLAGRDLRVDFAQRREDRKPREERPRVQRSSSEHSVFLGNLAWDVNTELVQDMINDVLGPDLFTSVRLATDRNTGRMRGFGHIDFKDQDSAEKAVIELNGLQVMGRQIRADHAEKKSNDHGTGSGGGASTGFSAGRYDVDKEEDGDGVGTW